MLEPNDPAVTACGARDGRTTEWPSARSTCYECFSPLALCYCGYIARIENRTRIIVAQHPREEYHPLNTARIVERSLVRAERVVEQIDRLQDALVRAGVDSDTAVLYPSPDAELLSEISPTRRPTKILVLDGTWHHAKTLLRDIPLLSQLRRVRFVREQPSEYRIRKEPKREYLSTVESVHYVLSSLEPETEHLDHLLHAFRQMIDLHQRARRPEGRSVRFVNRSQRRPHRFPASLAADPGRFVSVYCEGTSRFASGGRDARRPLYVSLQRPFLESSEPLERLNKNTCTHPTSFNHNIGMSEDDLTRALPLDAVRCDVEAFLDAGDVVCVWNNSSAQILSEIGVRPPQILGLKAAYCDFVRYLHFRDESYPLPSSAGDLDEVIVRSHIPWTPPLAPGRGLRRLTQTTALLRWLLAALATNGSL